MSNGTRSFDERAADQQVAAGKRQHHLHDPVDTRRTARGGPGGPIPAGDGLGEGAAGDQTAVGHCRERGDHLDTADAVVWDAHTDSEPSPRGSIPQRNVAGPCVAREETGGDQIPVLTGQPGHIGPIDGLDGDPGADL